ncbi:Hsp70 family protein [Aliiroseovarius crassostreae]|uniref:Hsp70 family protein n=2 Tax=Aliiroseovarius crassostreae TaxID=154981 RepID=A0A9Q9LV17_9RHOB|nr:Hsp70 family protein [Aliiroseovarius crassostreae]UWP91305.1 Hsp70 family protein [Aliiroseovarius crassostreae]UWP96945.1 Hsp70 family protein [Aliiroseovarius crassostreae]
MSETSPEQPCVLAVDFGTSNTALALIDGNRIRRIPVEGAYDTLPTAVFFPSDGGPMRIGRAAADALIDGEEGRYMRALKSILGQPLLHESRLLGGKRQTLADVITAFLIEVRTRAEAATGKSFTHAVSGRPVRFHSDNDAQDQQAEADLRACYLAAGFEKVEFLYEPEAAALACHKLARHKLACHKPGENATAQTGMIVDIGGGTSDFTLYRDNGGTVEILASHGIRLGGTDFDQRISLTHVMGLLGHGGTLKRSFGEGVLPMPKAIFQDLSTWPMIPFLYTRETERKVDDLLAHAINPEKLTRLKEVITAQLGHELAFAVEAGKIAANAATPRAMIDMAFIERNLSAPITPGSMTAALNGPEARFDEALKGAIYQTLMRANCLPAQIDRVVLVGGSSLMHLVSDVITATCPQANLTHSEAFTAVVDGLAIATAPAPQPPA